MNRPRVYWDFKALLSRVSFINKEIDAVKRKIAYCHEGIQTGLPKGRPVGKGECGVVGTQESLESQLLTSPKLSLSTSQHTEGGREHAQTGGTAR